MSDKLVNAGISASDVSNLIRRHGDEVLKTVEDALDLGLTQPVIMEALNLGGKVFLEIMSGLKLQQLKFTAQPQIVEGERVDSFDAPLFNNNLIQILLQQLLPVLVQQLLTPDNLQKLIALLINSLKPAPVV